LFRQKVVFLFFITIKPIVISIETKNIVVWYVKKLVFLNK